MENQLNGVLLLDKPQGITSNKALQQVKKLFGGRIKAGHTGSLDPLATGMLPICFGEATKFAAFLLNSDKKYLVTAQLGVKTDSGDLDGNIIEQTTEHKCFIITEAQIHTTLKKFIGEITQIPPKYSAIKQNGVRLYKLARKNIDVVVKPRTIKIHNIKLISFCNNKQQITLEVHCSKGTYIRSLIEDIGATLNCAATVSMLRRITVGNFAVNNMVTMDNLEQILSNNNNRTTIEQLILPVTSCLSDLPVLKINQDNAKLLYYGQIISVDYLPKYFNNKGTLICLVTKNSANLIGVGEVVGNNRLIAKRLVNRFSLTLTEKVVSA